jgi:hypothetical protein
MRPPLAISRPGRRWSLLLALSIASLACGGGSSSDGASESSSSSEGGDDSEDIDESLAYGYIRLQFEAADGVTGDPFVGTDTVIATLGYGECLAGFYADHPQLRQYEPAGALVFGTISAGGEGWQDRLCADNIGDHVDCSIVWITQQLDATKDLTVTYRVTAPLAGGSLLFGPVPTAATSGCAAPEMRVAGAAIAGKDVDDQGIWQADAFAPASATTNQGAPIVVSVVRVE